MARLYRSSQLPWPCVPRIHGLEVQRELPVRSERSFPVASPTSPARIETDSLEHIMSILELTAPSSVLGPAVHWTHGWARAQEKYLRRLEVAELGEATDRERSTRCRKRLGQAEARFGRCVQRKPH